MTADSPTMRETLLVHLAVLRRYAHGLADNRADAEDLLHATILRALETERLWRGENGRAWLFTLMTNLNRNRLRGLARQPVLGAISDAGELPDDSRGDPLMRTALMRALATLPTDARAVLLLVAVEGFTYAECAAILDIPIGTVMSRLSRARRQLSELLDRPAERGHRLTEGP